MKACGMVEGNGGRDGRMGRDGVRAWKDALEFLKALRQLFGSTINIVVGRMQRR